jgi:hypothetical protein
MENKVDDLIQFYLNKHSLEQIELLEANAVKENNNKLIRAHEREDLYRQQGDTYREE